MGQAPGELVMVVLFHALLLLLIPSNVLSAGFGDIPGDYCKIRTPVQCCVNRDDDCTMPILGNHLCEFYKLCLSKGYCDMFCRRPDSDNGDCCPDFKYVCENVPIKRPGECKYQGVVYPTGTTIQQNCNQCTCEDAGNDKHYWNCPNKEACLIDEDLMHKVNSGRFSWTARNYTSFWGKPLSFGIKYRLGTLFPDVSVKNMNEILIKPDHDLPDRFDAREEWPQYIHDVRDQENCGSSWAFSTTALSADRLAIMSEGKLLTKNTHLSSQQLLSCNQNHQLGCDGGNLDRAWWYIRKLGVVSEDCYPYNSGRTNEPGSCQTPKADYSAGRITCPSPYGDTKVFKMTPPYRISNKTEEIMTEIKLNGPVQATFKVKEDFFMYSGGVYSYANAQSDPRLRNEGYHSVRLLGWGEERSTGRPIKYWLAANSWGPQWGEEGTFRIQRGDNHCEIEAFIIGAWGKGSKKRRRHFRVRRLKLKHLRKLRL